MKDFKIFFGCFVLAVLCALSVDCRADDDQSVRENPEIDGLDNQDYGLIETVDLSKYPFLNADADSITLNGADWTSLSLALGATDESVLRIVHIGDSHIQADFATGRTRKLFQQKFGSAGRGLIVPLKLAGTNEPRDYTITSSSSFQSEKLLRYPWSAPMGFTGISLLPESNEFDFSLSAQEPFERIYIYYNGSALNVNSVCYQDSPLVYGVYEGSGWVEIGLPFPCEEVRINLSSFGDVAVHGMELVSDIIGVVYHAIGINGATFGCYDRVDGFGRAIAALEPHLIILSLGTNEAFGKLDSAEFLSNVNDLVTDLVENNPGACVLLTTPAECQRRVGRRRRSSFKVNDNVAVVSSLLRDYAVANHVALYDWYEAAGGQGSSSKWISAGLFSRDRIHYSLEGYDVAGQKIFDAIMNTLGYNEIEK